MDEMPKAVVVALLQTGRGRHGPDHPPFSHPAQLLEDDGERPSRCGDNSRGKVQNVREERRPGEGTALIRSPLLGHEAGNGGYMPRGSLRLRPVLSYSEAGERSPACQADTPAREGARCYRTRPTNRIWRDCTNSEASRDHSHGEALPSVSISSMASTRVHSSSAVISSAAP
jgi:hypothetical protein